jgi:hypothetical protein
MLCSFKNYIKEIGDKREFVWEKSDYLGGIRYRTTFDIEGDKVNVDFDYVGLNEIDLSFSVNTKISRNDTKAKNPNRVLVMLISAVRDFFKRYIKDNKDIKILWFSCADLDFKPLYRTFANRISKDTGWQVEEAGNGTSWELIRP